MAMTDERLAELEELASVDEIVADDAALANAVPDLIAEVRRLRALVVSSPDTDYVRSVAQACRDRRADQDEAANVLQTCAADLDALRAMLSEVMQERVDA